MILVCETGPSFQGDSTTVWLNTNCIREGEVKGLVLLSTEITINSFLKIFLQIIQQSQNQSTAILLQKRKKEKKTEKPITSQLTWQVYVKAATTLKRKASFCFTTSKITLPCGVSKSNWIVKSAPLQWGVLILDLEE